MTKSLQEQLADLEATNAELFKQRAPIEKKMTRTWNAIKKVQKQIDEESIKTMEENGVDWKWILQPAADFGSIEMNQYFSQQVYDLGMNAGGRWTESKQPAVSIMLTYGDPESLKKNIAGVKLLSKYYKKVDGEIPFGIFEHGFSEHAAYSMTYNPTTKKVTLLTNRYGKVDKKNLGTLGTAMKYIQEHHWYDGREEEREDYYY